MLKSLSREAWSRESNWIGYVAVATDRGKQRLGRREIVVAWRGTIRDLEWSDVFNPIPVSIAPILSQEQRHDHDHDHHWYDRVLHLVDEEEPKVMNGWFVIYTSTDPKSPFTKSSAREQFLAEIKRLVELYKDEELSITLVGHSLGAALAILSGFDIVQSGLTSVPGKPNIPVTAFVVGCPGVGNAAFKKRFEALPGLRVLRIVNLPDLIPHYPGKLLMGEQSTPLSSLPTTAPMLSCLVSWLLVFVLPVTVICV
uniref:Phospholipase A1 n=1 Tax=Picea sitchensis TaxID=3332 RepID=A9NQW7_PICSI|nr:unknown [Picea sitchensis]ABK23975.1 unknown [Picea sitchensis]